MKLSLSLLSYSEEFKKLSSEAKDLIRLMLCVDPAKRVSATEALQHPWVTRKNASEVHREHLKNAHENLKSRHFERKDLEDDAEKKGLSWYRRRASAIVDVVRGKA